MEKGDYMGFLHSIRVEHIRLKREKHLIYIYHKNNILPNISLS
jgi:hypothetical protein